MLNRLLKSCLRDLDAIVATHQAHSSEMHRLADKARVTKPEILGRIMCVIGINDKRTALLKAQVDRLRALQEALAVV